MTLRVGSLFSGIGGFDLGLERAGMRVVWQCEADAFCRRVLARHWPGVPCYPDVCDLRAADVEPVDVLCGGFPCQDISLAGRGGGIDGARSGLWSEYARLVRELRPRYVIVENVPALRSRGLGRVLGDLAALGYDAEWDCLPASAFGAPHQRDRIWLVAYPAGEQHEVGSPALGRPASQDVPTDASGGGREQGQPDVQAWQSDAQGRSGDLADSEREGLEREERGWTIDGGQSGGVADADEVGRAQGLRESTGADERSRPGDVVGSGELQDADGSALLPWRVGGRVAQAGGSEWWAVEPPVGRVAHGVPNRLVQLAALGNALVPLIPEQIGQRILDYEREFVT